MRRPAGRKKTRWKESRRYGRTLFITRLETEHRRRGCRGRQGRECVEGELQQGDIHKPKITERGDGRCLEVDQGVREQSNRPKEEYQIEEDNMVQTMTQDVKDRIADLERQKIELQNRLEMLSYANNMVKMVEIEQEIDEIEDTIGKLLP